MRTIKAALGQALYKSITFGTYEVITAKMRLLISIFAFVFAKRDDITIDEVQRRPLSAAFEINLDKVDVWIEGNG